MCTKINKILLFWVLDILDIKRKRKGRDCTCDGEVCRWSICHGIPHIPANTDILTKHHPCNQRQHNVLG